jgi:UDP-N-acetylmuramyl pentapeptide phosphotransferase/UDP-N-acetylglucosamine-1-phosphate transferase
MSNFFVILFYPILIYLVNFFSNKKNLIPNFSGDNHQKFFKKNNTQLTGGILLIPIFFLITFDYSIVLSIILILIFLLGLSSDIGYFSSAKLRLLIQSIIILYFLISTETILTSVRIEKFDLLLDNYWFSLFFTLMCFMILTNGTNFIDGLNGLVLTYSLLIILIIVYLRLFEFSFLSHKDMITIIIVFSYLVLFNYFNKLYVGDSGSYLIGFLLGYILLQIYESNPYFSPYFIALLLWYPVFEILFSIIRKIRINISPLKPDNRHLHHLLFLYLEKKFKFKTNTTNNLTSILIIVYNLLIFLIAIQDIYSSSLHVLLFTLNIFIYLMFYSKLNYLKKS